MGYSALSSDLQTLVMFNYEQFGKFFVLFIIFAVSLIYKFYWKPHKQQLTSFLADGVIRMLLDKASKWILVISPFFIIFMHPEYTFWVFMTMFTKLFGVFIGLWIILIGIDIIRLGTIGTAKIAGMDLNDPTVNKFLKEMEKISWFK